LAQRLRHVPDQCRAQRPGRTPAPSAGAASRWSRC
jgi:hypothetical protein